jgi:hypothetical protein
VHLEDREVYFKKVDGTGLRRSGGVWLSDLITAAFVT